MDMQSLSIWHWIIIAVLIVLVVAAIALFARAINQRRPGDRGVQERGSAAPISGPSGFGGWLIVLAIGVFLFPVVTLLLLLAITDFVALDAGTYQLGLIIPSWLYVLLFLVQCCTALFMARRARRFMPFYKGTATAMILFKPVSRLLFVALVSLANGLPFGHALTVLITDQSANDLIPWLVIAIGLTISIVYVSRSRRVANTFVR